MHVVWFHLSKLTSQNRIIILANSRKRNSETNYLEINRSNYYQKLILKRPENKRNIFNIVFRTNFKLDLGNKWLRTMHVVWYHLSKLTSQNRIIILANRRKIAILKPITLRSIAPIPYQKLILKRPENKRNIFTIMCLGAASS